MINLMNYHPKIVQSVIGETISLASHNSHWEELLQSVSDLFSANTADTDPGVSGVSRDQKFYEKFKNTHCQVDHPAKIE